MACSRGKIILKMVIKNNEEKNQEKSRYHEEEDAHVSKMTHTEIPTTAAALFATMRGDVEEVNSSDMQEGSGHKTYVIQFDPNEPDTDIPTVKTSYFKIPAISDQTLFEVLIPGPIKSSDLIPDVTPALKSQHHTSEDDDANKDEAENSNHQQDVEKDNGNDKEVDIRVASANPAGGVPEDASDEPAPKKQKTKPQPIREPCREACKKKCTGSISQEQRETIWQEYWCLTYNGKRDMIYKHVLRTGKTRATKGEHDSRRNVTFRYKLPDANGDMQGVCKVFFLGTLGYHPKNDRIITTVMQTTAPSSLAASKDKRGRHTNRPHKMDKADLEDHINSFNPSVNHYRRPHAPNRLYLPIDVTVRCMYEDYKAHNPPRLCTYETYQKQVSDMNISFTKLGEEECERCKTLEVHQKEKHVGQQDYDPDCSDCNQQKEHKYRAKLARTKYHEDAENYWGMDWSVRSVDLQKVIMLPRMPGNKTAIFTKRIVAYHEIFAPLGSREKKKDTISVVWHEDIAKRNAFVTAFKKERDVNHMVIWLDNCTAQHKNWFLFTWMVALVNSDQIMAKDITFRFFEPGHTFMSADSFHHGVEREVRNRPGGNVYDFPDFVDIIKKSNSGRVDVIVMENEAVRSYIAGNSTYKLKKIGEDTLFCNMAVVQFRRGSKHLHVKLSHDQEHSNNIDFLKKNFQLKTPSLLRTEQRGIPADKKADIIAKLCPQMPQNRLQFWINLAVGDDPDESI